ncbi:MAG: tRNA (adenine-N1)-methyltransferase [Candidatus Altiarchaeota archaeon]
MYLLIDREGKTYLVKANEDIHTKDGVIKKEKLKFNSIVETHLGKKFFVLRPNIIDFIKKAKLGPQRISLKDCGLIAAYTGISSGSKVLDAGTGSGVLAMFLANIVAPKKLVSYEIREDFAKIAKENFKKAGIKNIILKMENIYEGISEKNLDLITLDLPEPWKVIEHAKKSLKVGGYLVAYSPSIEQTKKFFSSLGESFYSETIECLVREWDMEVLRPYSRMLAHTGFITFARFLGSK